MSARAWLLVGAVCLLTACAGSGTRSNKLAPEQIRRSSELQVQMAQEYLKRGNLEIARDKLLRALELDPNSGRAHTVSGVLNETIGELGQAEFHYKRAVDLRSKDGDMSNNFASFLCRQGRYPEAEVMFKRAFADPYYKTPEVALSNAGMCAKSAGHLEQAEAYLREALQRKPDYGDALLPMAGVLFASGDHMNARAFMQRFDAANPNNPEAVLLGMQIELALGDTRSAADYRRRLTSSFPRSREAQSLEQRE